MHRTAIINVVGLTESLLGADTPRISSFLQRGALANIVPAFPAVTCTAQSTYLTGSPASAHGIVGNGWYNRELAEVQFWKQSNHLVQGRKLWEELRERDSKFTCAKLFWWYNMYSTADYSVTPRPMYPADGRKVFDIYTWPVSLRNELKHDLGEFPFPTFWGPAAGTQSPQGPPDAASRWIVNAAKWLENKYHPTLNLIYLPHLDYNLQRFGPEANSGAAHSPSPWGGGQGEGNATRPPSPRGEGQGDGNAARSPSPRGEGQGEGNAARPPSPRGEGQGEGNAARPPSPRGEGQGEGNAARPPSPCGEGQGEGNAACPPSPWGEGQGEGNAARPPSPCGEGQGEGNAARPPSPRGEGQGEGNAPRSPSPWGEGQGEGNISAPCPKLHANKTTNPAIIPDLRAIDSIVGELIDFFSAQSVQVILLSEYGITQVDWPIHLNRLFRQEGWLAVKEELGLELLDCGASKVFAVADHQIAHIYLNDHSLETQVRELLQKQEGIAQVLGPKEKSAMGIDHSRAGDLIAVADENAWFTYYYWLDDRLAPDFARTVDIHRKPGYDPVELFLNPKITFPKLKIAWRLLQKRLGFRMLMDVIPLDPTLVKGSHGCRPSHPSDYPVLISPKPGLVQASPIDATDVYHVLKRHILE